MEDIILLTYFNELSASVLMDPKDVEESFKNIAKFNIELIEELKGNTSFWKEVHKQWRALDRDSKVSSKLSSDHSGNKVNNKVLSNKINSFFENLQESAFVSTDSATLLSLNIRLSLYINIYNKLLKQNQLSSKQVDLLNSIEDLRDKLVKANLRLVVAFSKPYQDKGVNFSDLIQEGNIGLLKAIDKYSLSANIRFSTYATWWIKQSCIRVIKSQSRIHIPANIQDKILRAKRSQENEQTSTELNVEDYEKLIGISSIPISLDSRSVVNNLADEPGEGLAGVLYDEEQSLPDQEYAKKSLAVTLKREIGKLDYISQQVLLLRNGLTDKPPLTLNEVGLELGISKELVRQTEASALIKLRSKNLKEFLYD